MSSRPRAAARPNHSSSHTINNRDHARIHIAILASYLGLALVLTWPLLRHFTTHVPGDGIDDPSLAWNLWWMRERLINQLNVNIFSVDWMFHPVDINLAFYTLTPLNGLLSIPLQLTSGLIVASNVVLLSSFVLGGYGTFLLVRWLLTQTDGSSARHHGVWVAAFAGVIYGFASSKLFYASLGQFNIASSQWIPFCVLYLLHMGHSTTRRAVVRNALLAGLFLVFQAWAELTYASFLLIFIAFYFVWRMTAACMRIRRDGVSGALSLLLGFTVMGVTFLVGIAPFLWAMVPDMLREGDFFASGGGFADIFSADLLGYWMPTRLHPLLGDWVATLPFPNDKGQQIYVGYTALILAGLGVGALLRKQGTARQQGWFWLAATGLFWLLTLGPQLRWAGAPLPIPGPFALISRLPFFSGNRYPSRYSVMLMLCVAVLAAFGAQYVIARIERARPRPSTPLIRSAAAAIILLGGLLFLLEHLSVPLPLNDARTPAIYAQLADAPGDFALLEFPTGWRNGARVLGRSDQLIMMQQWYQSVHGKRRLGGNTSRNPLHKFQYFVEAPLINDWIALMNADQSSISATVESELDAMIARGQAHAATVLDFLDVQYVTVHALNHGTPAPDALLRYIDEALPLTLVDEWAGPDWTGEPSAIRLYRVESPPGAPQAWEIDLGTREGALYLAEGWSTLPDRGVRYATRPFATLLLDLPNSGGELDLELFGPATGVEIRLAGRTLATRALSGGPTGERITVDVPPDLAREPVDRLELHFTGPLTPVQALHAADDPRGWPIGETGAFLPDGSNLVVRSAGKDVGDFAQIWIDGVDHAPNQLGYNVVAIDAGGTMLASAVFDTLNSAQASADLAAWLGRWPEGTIIAGAVRDTADVDADGFRNLSQATIDALQQIGVSSDLRGKHRWSHAFIGVAGAPTGTALEQTDVLRPASAFVGAAVDNAQVSGGVGSVRFTPSPGGP